MAEATRTRRGKGRPDDGRSNDHLFDRELDHLPPEVRWREWMNRVEATIFAASEPVGRDTLARIVGKTCSIDLLIDDIREELRGRRRRRLEAPDPAGLCRRHPHGRRREGARR